MEVDQDVKVKIHASLPPLPPPIPITTDEEQQPFPPDKRSQPHLNGTYEWLDLLNEPGFAAASVSSFSHVSLIENKAFSRCGVRLVEYKIDNNFVGMNSVNVCGINTVYKLTSFYRFYILSFVAGFLGSKI